jgi:hypothetical protein
MECRRSRSSTARSPLATMAFDAWSGLAMSTGHVMKEVYDDGWHQTIAPPIFARFVANSGSCGSCDIYF